MTETGVVPVEASKETRYYHALSKAHDDLMRCSECQALVLHTILIKLGSCKCGCKRVKEITTLSEVEWADIASGVIDFPYREQFMREFETVDV